MYNPDVIEPDRVQTLNGHPTRAGQYVLYWMQASQRSVFNPALEYAIEQANKLDQPLVVGFGLMDDYPEANARHYQFLLEGLGDVEAGLKSRGIRFVVRRGQPAEMAAILAKKASSLICDRGYTRHQKRWRDQVADEAGCSVVQVEGDVVVPVERASDKTEFAARTIRPKIMRQVDEFLVPLKAGRPRHSSLNLKIAGDIDVTDPAAALAKMKVDRSVAPSTRFAGGQIAAGRLLAAFIKSSLPDYSNGRKDVSQDGTSLLAPYLHFGQISPVQIALVVRKSDAPKAEQDVFLEELIVRRELSVNYIHYSPHYDEYEGIPAWARKALAERQDDARPTIYSREQMEHAKTADPYWNAAQLEMTRTGFMHNAMRMYWGKKFIEWKTTPQEAFADAMYLNNKYFLCGRDPASYANIGWLFGLHDRPWARRPIFGTVRYMNAAGLKRKLDMESYLKRVEGFAAKE